MLSELSIRLIQDKKIANIRQNAFSVPLFFRYLKDKYLFGSEDMASHSKHQDRREIFNIAIRPLLQFAAINNNIDLYSSLDHFLFNSYICPVEDIDWFRQAFWDVNSYGLSIARSLRDSDNLRHSKINSKSVKKILFIFKGPFRLAHADVLKDFLLNIKSDKSYEVQLLLLDHPPFDLPNIKIISFWKVQTVAQKLSMYIHLCRQNNYYNIVWVACVQNLSLYMGLRLSSNQSYWTMKRHSIIFPEVTKYATFISQYRNKVYNNVFWFGGRYRLNAKTTQLSKTQICQKYGDKVFALKDKFVYGSLTRDQKYQNLEYWKGIELLLLESSKSVFIYGASTLTDTVSRYINESKILTRNTINFGWLKGNTTDIASLIQVYVDTIPFGSGLTAAECILAGGCYLGVLSEINKEASFTNILFDAINLCSKTNVPYNTPMESLGIFSDYTSCIKQAKKLQHDKQKAYKLHVMQKRLLTNLNNLGQKYFTDDYLQYFLN